jgi:flagellar biosynthesis protein FlhF
MHAGRFCLIDRVGEWAMLGTKRLRQWHSLCIGPPAMQAQGRRTQPEVPSSPPAEAGSSYRFLVRTAEEAVGAIRNQLGEDARVVSVRSVKAGGFMGLMGNTRLEVIAQVPAPVRQPAAVAFSEDTRLTVDPAAPSAPQPVAGRSPASLYASAASAAAPANTPASLVVGAGPTAAAAPTRRNAPPQRLDALLRRTGLSEQLIARLQASEEWAGNDEDRPLHQGLLQVAGQIRHLAAGAVSRPLPARTAFLGMPGVGRTTALCKWLSAEVFTRGLHGGVGSIEFDRQLGTEDLAVYAELLGLEYFRQVPAVEQGGGGGFCYLDVPPLSLTRTEENARLQRFLDDEGIAGRVLVVSALHDLTLLRQTCAIGVDMGCTHVIFTQLDELPQWGKLWDFLIESPLTPLLLTLGPSLSGECETDVVEAVLRRTFPWN